MVHKEVVVLRVALWNNPGDQALFQIHVPQPPAKGKVSKTWSIFDDP